MSGLEAAAIASVSAVVCIAAAAAFRPIEARVLRWVDGRLKRLIVRRIAPLST